MTATSNRFPPALWERILVRAQAGHAHSIRLLDWWIGYVNDQRSAWSRKRGKQ